MVWGKHGQRDQHTAQQSPETEASTQVLASPRRNAELQISTEKMYFQSVVVGTMGWLLI